MSSDGSKLLYIAERKRPDSVSYFTDNTRLVMTWTLLLVSSDCV